MSKHGTFFCDNCSSNHDYSNMDCIRAENEVLCEVCYENLYSECASCGGVYSKITMHPTDINHTSYVCNGCIENDPYWFKCDDCLRATPLDDVMTDANVTLCSSCFERNYELCGYCDAIIRIRSNSIVDVYRGYGMSNLRINFYRLNSSYVCSSCYISRTIRCSSCGLRFDPISSDSRFLCRDCLEDYYDEEYDEEDDYDDRYSDWVHSYSYKPEYIHYALNKKDHKETKYGVELEIEFNRKRYLDEDTEYFIDKYSSGESLWFFKEDGSINFGAELVTQPCTLEFHKKKFPWVDMLADFRKKGCKSHNTESCGLHIHMSKDGITSDDMIKIGAFIHSEFHRQEITRIARRISSGYGRFLKKQKASDYGKNDGRGEAVNFQPYMTIEFRLFRGSLIPETVLSSIEFCDSIKNFVKTLSVAKFFSHNIWNVYIDFLYTNKNKYKNLINYMQVRQCLNSIIGNADYKKEHQKIKGLKAGNLGTYEPNNYNRISMPPLEWVEEGREI